MGCLYPSMTLVPDIHPCHFLHNIDVDVIKIDKSFTDMITADDKTAILVESIITIAQRLKMEVIAEGVETKEQGKKLVELGCNLLQGIITVSR